MKVIRIRSKNEGFRRCGIAHSVEWMEHPADRFSKEEIERLENEPMLQVEKINKKDSDEPEEPS